MAQKLYKKLISAMAYEGVCNASDVDITKTFLGQQYSKVGAIIDAITSFLSSLVGTSLTREIVQTLPTKNISETTIYLVLRDPTGASGYIYDEYMYVDTQWKIIGSTDVDLTNYVQKPSNAEENAQYVMSYNGEWVKANITTDASKITYTPGNVQGVNTVQTAIDALASDATLARQLKDAICDEVGETAQEIITSGTIVFHDGRFYKINNKVFDGDRWSDIDAEPITINDVLDELRNAISNNNSNISDINDKLQYIEDDAQKNVQSDWYETDPTSDRFILHKPDASGIAIEEIQGLDAETIQDALEEILGLGVAGRWFTGSNVSGMWSTVSVTDAKVGDLYLNTNTNSAYFGNVYQLTKGTSGTNTWINKVKIASTATLNETTDAQGYKHVTVSVTSGGKTTTSSDLMAPVNEVLDAIDKIMKPSTASLTASSTTE